ncbi:MAG TPA: TIGR03905 family TSCPD domain-containing protein [Armatimonadota bacterium]|nr:TIGR03905 family TSCPD domain-containing protein [Armatimonadota bacterium]
MIYRTHGTCSQEIHIEVNGDTIEHIEFVGGCQGNLQGICRLVDGMKVSEVIQRLQGIKCGSKNTSCPDQLVHALRSIHSA